MPAQPKATLEKVLELLGLPATVEEHQIEDGLLLDIKTDDAGRLTGPALRRALWEGDIDPHSLLAVVASMYAVYHGPDGLRRIAADVTRKAHLLRDWIVEAQRWAWLSSEVCDAGSWAVAMSRTPGVSQPKVDRLDVNRR